MRYPSCINTNTTETTQDLFKIGDQYGDQYGDQRQSLISSCKGLDDSMFLVWFSTSSSQ